MKPQIEEGSYLTFNEIQKVLAAAKDEVERLFLETLFYTGARVSEIVGIGTGRREDSLISRKILQSKGCIVLRNLKGKKGRKKRWKNVYVPEEFITRLLDYCVKNKIGSSEPIFNFTRFTAYRLVRRVCKAAGFEYVGSKFAHPHNLRHSAAMYALGKKVDMKFIQKQLGHADISMLSEYMTLRPEVIEKERKKLWGK